MDPLHSLLSGSDAVVAETYDRLLAALRSLGPVVEEPNKSSIHLKPAAAASAFAGIHPRRAALLLNIRTVAAIVSPRIRKTEQVSRNRAHNELLLTSPNDVDAELLGWLADSYALASTKTK